MAEVSRTSRAGRLHKGKVAGDEIKFTRTVAESIKEELIAKRVKESSAK